MGLFDILDAQKRLRRTALESPDRGRRLAAIGKLDDQEALALAARNDADHTVRSGAIDRLGDLQALAEIALRNADESERQRAVRRYCEVGNAEDFFSEALKRSGDRRRLAGVAGNLEWPWPLEKLLKGTADAELVRRIMPDEPQSGRDPHYSRRYRIRQLCEERLREIENENALRQLSQDGVTDEERAAVARDQTRPFELRKGALEQITDDALLAEIAAGQYTAGITEAALDRIRDGGILADAAAKADPGAVRRMYPKLMERCDRYTPEYVVLDRVAEGKTRKAALARVTDPDVLLALAMQKDDDVDLREDAVARLADREKLGTIAAGCDDLRLRWCAARRAGDEDQAKRIEDMANRRVNGHAVIVLDDQQYCYEARCIRCGRRYGREEDIDAGMTRERGKDFAKFPCEPDFPRL